MTPDDIERAGSILKQVRVALSPNHREAMIHLRPPELGRISIRLNVEDGRASAVVRAESVEALDVLSRHLPELRASLEQQNLTADEIDLGLGFEESGHGSERPGNEGPDANLSHEDEHLTPSAETRALARVVAGTAGIDMYA
jgi:flagellar hook-length control protein FliK